MEALEQEQKAAPSAYGKDVRLPKIGLALGSGVARGWAHIGVLRALRKIGIEPDIICGCSIGAVVGGIYLANKLDELEEWARDLTKLKIVSYLDLKVRDGGIIGGGRIGQEIYKHLGEIKIEELPKAFAAVTADMVTGHEIWLRNGLLKDAIQASFALPGIFPPVNVDKRWLVDGALVNPVPVSVCRSLGAEMVIAVNLNADLLGKVRRPDMSVPTVTGFDLVSLVDEHRNGAVPVISKKGLLDSFTQRLFQRDSDGPSLFGVLVNTINIMQDRIARARLAGDPPDVQITPRLGHVGLLEFDRAAEAITEGEAAVQRAETELGDAFRVFFRKGSASG
ncbi:MAG: patatin-like phospholipase family protein [Bdellovibrionales bacterium]